MSNNSKSSQSSNSSDFEELNMKLESIQTELAKICYEVLEDICEAALFDPEEASVAFILEAVTSDGELQIHSSMELTLVHDENDPIEDVKAMVVRNLFYKRLNELKKISR